jgi:SAM-dependent methyltransferase
MANIKKYSKSVLKTYLNQSNYDLIVELYLNVISLWFFGFRFVCPICERHFRKLLPFGIRSRENAKCPRCGSLERHRLLWLYLKEKTGIFKNNMKVLDIAPMECLQRRFKKMQNISYISADLSASNAMIKMDITNIDLPDNQFDCIFCYHVLDDIKDDIGAMKELYRILRPGGWAILQSPINVKVEKTIEITNDISEECERMYGVKDEIKIYGNDYKERLEKAGFVVKMDNYIKEQEDDVIEKYCLIKDEIICYCTKPG